MKDAAAWSGQGRAPRDGASRLTTRCLQFLVIAGTAAIVVWLLGRVLVVVVPVVIAVLLTTLLEPPTVGELSGSVAGALVQLERFGEQHLGPDAGQLDRLLGEAQRYFLGGTGWSTAVTGVRTAVEVLTGTILTVFLAVYFVHDGQRLARGALRLAPSGSRDRIAQAGRTSWTVLGGYVRGAALIGLADAVLIGTGLWLLDVRLALSLAVLTFFGACVPLLGAFLSGLLVAVVALVDQGPGVALAVVALTLVVQQVEGNLLAPRILAHTLNLHPVVTTCAVTTGGLVGGIFGAFIAVPVTTVATAYTAARAHREFVMES